MSQLKIKGDKTKTVVTTTITRISFDHDEVEAIVRDYVRREYNLLYVNVDFVGAKYEGCSANCVVTFKEEKNEVE